MGAIPNGRWKVRVDLNQSLALESFEDFNIARMDTNKNEDGLWFHQKICLFRREAQMSSSGLVTMVEKIVSNTHHASTLCRSLGERDALMDWFSASVIRNSERISRMRVERFRKRRDRRASVQMHPRECILCANCGFFVRMLAWPYFLIGLREGRYCVNQTSVPSADLFWNHLPFLCARDFENINKTATVASTIQGSLSRVAIHLLWLLLGRLQNLRIPGMKLRTAQSLPCQESSHCVRDEIISKM